MARNRISFVEGRLKNLSIARSRIVAMLMSIALASLFWFLVNLNKRYQAELILPAKMVGIPDTIKVNPYIFPRVRLSVEGLGGNLMTYLLRIQRDTLEISFRQDLQEGFLLTQNLQSVWQRAVKGITLQGVLSPDSLRFSLDYQVEKKVPLRSQVDVRLATSYVLENDPVLLPDSVRLVGPKRVLDTLNAWYTEELSTSFLSQEQSIQVGILDTFSQIQVEPIFAYLRVKPRLYSQMELTVPIHIINTPNNVEIKLQHPSILITCLVPMDIFETIQAQEYQLEVDYQDIDLRIPYFLPDFSFLPEPVRVVFSSPYEVPYVVVTK